MVYYTHRIHVCYIYTYIYHQYTPNVSIYTIHGSYGIVICPLNPTVNRVVKKPPRWECSMARVRHVRGGGAQGQIYATNWLFIAATTVEFMVCVYIYKIYVIYNIICELVMGRFETTFKLVSIWFSGGLIVHEDLPETEYQQRWWACVGYVRPRNFQACSNCSILKTWVKMAHISSIICIIYIYPS